MCLSLDNKLCEHIYRKTMQRSGIQHQNGFLEETLPEVDPKA